LLDVGCGEGKITAEIAARLPRGQALGVDNSAEMIRLAQEEFPRQKFPNLSFQLADARTLPFADEFDVVFSNAALHWIRGHQPVLCGISRSLKRGGRILLQMGGQGNAGEILAALDVLLAQPSWSKYFSGFSIPYGFYSVEEYSVWLAEAGLETQRLEIIPKDMSYPQRSGLEGWLRTTWLPYTQRVPAEKREDFLNALLDVYLSNHPADEQGVIHVYMARLEVQAVKP